MGTDEVDTALADAARKDLDIYGYGNTAAERASNWDDVVDRIGGPSFRLRTAAPPPPPEDDSSAFPSSSSLARAKGWAAGLSQRQQAWQTWSSNGDQVIDQEKIKGEFMCGDIAMFFLGRISPRSSRGRFDLLGSCANRGVLFLGLGAWGVRSGSPPAAMVPLWRKGEGL